MNIEDNFEYNFEFLPEPIPIVDQAWPKGTRPLVHSHTLAYNHEKYIAETIDGILMQKTTFPVQILIHDDASEDNTVSIIKKYMAKYPNLIKAYFQEENIYKLDSKIRKERKEEYNSWKIGKYEAMCEGDDYWIDPLKLQKQVIFLEKNLDYSFCCGGAKRLYEANKKIEGKVFIPNEAVCEKNGYIIDLELTKKYYLTSTLTMVYRYELPQLAPLLSMQYSKDLALSYLLLKNNWKGFYFTEIFGIYRIHPGGVNSMQSVLTNLIANHQTYAELFSIDKSDYNRYKTFYSGIGLINYCLYHRDEGCILHSKIKLVCDTFLLIKNFSEILDFIKAFVSKNVRNKLKLKRG